MGYLVCEKCGGYYKLQPGESPEDFDNECECGGKLKYYTNFTSEGVFTNEAPENPKSKESLFKKILTYDLDLKLELKLYGILMIAFAIAEFVFSYIIISFQAPFFLLILSLIMGFILAFLAIISFFFVNRSLYFVYSAASVLLFLQYWILSDTLKTPKTGAVIFLFMAAYFVQLAMKKV